MKLKNLFRNNRMEKLQKLHWEYTDHIPEHVGEVLEDIDFKYHKEYSKIIDKYSKSISKFDFDLTKVNINIYFFLFYIL